ncbi:unnamed protein product [Triticum turgidum subsp. durum]|uniref:Uncharacterized protein n=1 Tax=Triticum turgidum subsp. durum TaxID=4567 RepID=A0A9R0ZDH0_TRITD|nr:unnamed protein product [Triticum turgidum subsp. durum]
MGRAVATMSPLQMVFLRRPAAGDLAVTASPTSDLSVTVNPRICLHLPPPPLVAGRDGDPNLGEEGARAAADSLWKKCAKFPGVGSIPLPRRGSRAPLPEPRIQELLPAHGDLLCAAPPLFLRIKA